MVQDKHKKHFSMNGWGLSFTELHSTASPQSMSSNPVSICQRWQRIQHHDLGKTAWALTNLGFYICLCAWSSKWDPGVCSYFSTYKVNMGNTGPHWSSRCLGKGIWADPGCSHHPQPNKPSLLHAYLLLPDLGWPNSPVHVCTATRPCRPHTNS